MNNYILNIKKPLIFMWNNFIDMKIKLINNCFILKDSLLKKMCKKPKTKSIEETIDIILENKCSVSRFGDGEFKLMIGKDISFQKCSENISKRLREVLLNDEANMIVCIPNIFESLDIYDKEPKEYWRLHVAKYRLSWSSLINLNKQYYNAFISRCYYCFKDKSNSKLWFEKIKFIWKDRNIVIIEGKKSRLGVGNDLFAKTKSIERILCPEEHAFNKYDEILSIAKKIDKSKLVLLALGPTATVLALDLCILGYQAIDIGHIDIEYEWYLAGAITKEKVKNKYVCEAGGAEDVGDCLDSNYIKEIVYSIK